MRNLTLVTLAAFGLTACAGIDITPISPSDEAAIHSGESKLKGYIVYQPMVVVEISQKKICSNKDGDEGCTTTCSAGAPFTLPNPAKPFLINPRSGFGKAGVDISISNGWQLGGIKDNSDNSVLLGTVEKLTGLAGLKAFPNKSKDEDPPCKASGLYQLNIKPDGDIELKNLTVYY